MDLSSLSFIFIFFVVFAIIYLVASPRFRLPIIFVASVAFLVWGQLAALWWLGGVLIFGYLLGRAIELSVGRQRKIVLWLGIIIALILLALVRYWIAFGTRLITLPPQITGYFIGFVMPLGLSYATLQTIGYLVDVFHGATPAEHNFVRFATYVLYFPKAISGPLMRYKPFADQLNHLEPTPDNIALGLRRILFGFCKRILLANQLAAMPNAAFGLDTPNFAPHIAWLALLAYTLQIYLDFSGYTDIALGLGQMMGLRLPENFDNPYQAESISDFWRRWHISLSTWFRQYVFFPLERYRLPRIGQQLNILIVFLLTGLWHGFNPHFIVWGLFHGVAVAIESIGFGRSLKKFWLPIRYGYTLLIMMIGWVFFRANSLAFAFHFLLRLVGDTSNLTPLSFNRAAALIIIDPSFWIILIASLIAILPINQFWKRIRVRWENLKPVSYLAFQGTEDLMLIALFLMSIAVYLTSQFAPNIYARF